MSTSNGRRKLGRTLLVLGLIAGIAFIGTSAGNAAPPDALIQ